MGSKDKGTKTETHNLSKFLTLPFSIQTVLFTKVKIRISVSEELTATFCLYDLDKQDGLSIAEISDKIGQVRTITLTIL